jgi:hypothetical protein
MFKCVNGWSKQTMVSHIQKEFKGYSIIIEKDNHPTCAYRGPEGKKCAVGLFIPDNKYKPEMDDGMSLKAVFNECLATMPLNYEGLALLQTVHDRSDGDETLEKILNWIEINVEVENV